MIVQGFSSIQNLNITSGSTAPYLAEFFQYIPEVNLNDGSKLQLEVISLEILVFF